MTEIFPYGGWRSPITSDLIVGESIGLSTVLVDGDDIYWIEGRPREGGRNVLVRWGRGGQNDEITPAPFNVRTRVHEYGGGAAAVSGGVAYFSHGADQRLYRVSPGGAPAPITPAADPGGSSWYYADGRIDGFRRRWIGVREEHRGDGTVDNTLAAVDPDAGGPGRILAQGYDFYASPRLSPDGSRLAWICWNHPNMPWVGTELWVAAIAADGSLANRKRIAGGPAESIFQPEWAPDGVLFFISDRTGWWNLYRCDPKSDSAAHPICPRAAEFGRAQWQFSQSTYAFLSPDRLACAYIEAGVSRLGILDPASGHLAPLDLAYTDFGSIRALGGQIVCLAGSPTDPLAVVSIDPATGAVQTLRKSTSVADDPDLRRCFAVPRHIEFPTEGGLTAFAHYYPPTNPLYSAPEGEKPPLVVNATAARPHRRHRC